ncbi:TetR/AcrR family transcriptional regulator C-terminal domain-containing protein [Sphaerisporangium aureirubrum]|uniref:TetR/AcrR family transcriptional regulator C-terminal domain-containing protein n=1 Tax=Sphaerisporangium aureirubrum TaxID=1544736 RepID=A0ABW1NVH2_9ACTN
MDKRPAVTRRTLIETGLRLLDEVGLDGLTVRRLAAELGVKSPALYWHIRTKQELLDGMADAIVRSGGMGPPHPGESWQDWLTRRAHAYRTALLSHRDAARVVVGATTLSPSAIQLFDRELRAMTAFGFTPVLALRTVATLTHYVTGFVLREQTPRPDPAPQPSPADLLDESSPLLAAVREGGGTAGTETFTHGLRALIDGTATALARSGDRGPADRGSSPR